MLPLELRECGVRADDRAVGRRRRGERKVLGADLPPVRAREQRHALDHRSQLVDVPGPGILLHPGEGVGGQLEQIREYLRSDEYVEFMARRVFGLVKPGETLVIVKAPPAVDEGVPDAVGRPWWQDLFGR